MKTFVTPLARPKKTKRGFTLIELLVALCVLGLLTTLAGGLLHSGVRVWEKTTRSAEGANEIEVAQSFLSRILCQASPEVIKNNNNGFVAFEGKINSLGFRAPLPNSLGEGAPSEIRIYIEDDKKYKKNLMVAWRRANYASHWKQEILLPDISEASWNYFEKSEGNGLQNWRPDWTEKRNVPPLIALDVEFPRGDVRVWPRLVVATMIAADSECLYDPGIRGCQRR